MTMDMDTVRMSYEDMIDILKGLVFGTFDRTTAKEREALDMAIKALQAEHCEDAISREDVIKAIDRHTFDTDDGLCLDEDISIILEEVAPVTLARKKGKWTNGDPICPCCGEDKFKDLDADIWADWQPKYCPNCGAEMGSEE